MQSKKKKLGQTDLFVNTDPSPHFLKTIGVEKRKKKKKKSPIGWDVNPDIKKNI